MTYDHDTMRRKLWITERGRHLVEKKKDLPKEGGTEAHPWRVTKEDFYPLTEVKAKLDDIEERLKKLEAEPTLSSKWDTLRSYLDKFVETAGALMIGALCFVVIVILVMLGLWAIGQLLFR